MKGTSGAGVLVVFLVPVEVLVQLAALHSLDLLDILAAPVLTVGVSGRQNATKLDAVQTVPDASGWPDGQPLRKRSLEARKTGFGHPAAAGAGTNAER